MAYDLEEQEQIDALKAWWNRFGNLLTWLLIAVLAAYSGWTAWNYYQRTQSIQASQLYEELQRAVMLKDQAKIQRAVADMQSKFGKTTYAQMSALTAAKAAFDAHDLKLAKTQLQWVIDFGLDDEYKAVAKIRLAGVLLDEKAYDAGLKLLGDPKNYPVQFAGAVEDRRGDILLAQNKTAEARLAYQAALQRMDQKNPGHQLIQLKLDALGGEVVTVVEKSAQTK